MGKKGGFATAMGTGNKSLTSTGQSDLKTNVTPKQASMTSATGSTKYEKVETQEYKSPSPFVSNSHIVTDPICALIFIACVGFLVFVLNYGFQNGDPRKVYHGMDWEGKLCGVDMPEKSYVYWCRKTPAASASLTNLSFAGTQTVVDQLTELDFHHPICVEYCPLSSASQSQCYFEETGTYELVTDYATRPLAHRYCMPQSADLLGKYNQVMDAHAINKYVPEIISSIREGWKVLLGVGALAFVLSMMFLLLIECFAGCVVWSCLVSMHLLPGACGGYLIYAHAHGGIDGMPGSGDSDTDLTLGIILCSISAVFFLVNCCMHSAVAKAIKVVEASAECLFSNKSLIFEPLLNFCVRSAYWAVMLVGGMHLIGVGEVRKSKVYRTFEYTTEENIFLVFYILMFIWGNDFITACSQYSIANSAARWYFTEHTNGSKDAGSCLLCRGYCNVAFHIGSLAFGSLIIAFTRPFRWIVVIIVHGGDVVENGACKCISDACGCCMFCFDNLLAHISKNAFIDMAITSKPFCAAGSDAARILSPHNKNGGAAFFALSGATWLFTFSGLGSITCLGALITSLVVTNVAEFSTPSSELYITDPMIMTYLSAVICFIVSLCFMLVFDSIADSIVLCMAMDYEEMCNNPLPEAYQAPKKPDETMFQSLFSCNRQTTSTSAPKAASSRPQYASKSMVGLTDSHGIRM